MDLAQILGELLASYQPTTLSPNDEQAYLDWLQKNNIKDPNAVIPGAGTYDYRGAYMAGVKPPSQKGGHWTSEFKMPGHPNQFVSASDKGWSNPPTQYGDALLDTKTGLPANLLQLLGMKM